MPFFKELRDSEVQSITKENYMTSRYRVLSERTDSRAHSSFQKELPNSQVHSSFQKLTGIPPRKYFKTNFQNSYNTYAPLFPTFPQHRQIFLQSHTPQNDKYLGKSNQTCNITPWPFTVSGKTCN
jgi:hypothetical protein